MKTSLVSLLLVTVAALSAPGCAAGPGDDDARGEDVAAAEEAISVDDPPTTKNGKSGLCFFNLGTMQAYQFWAGQALDSGGGILPSFLGVLTICRDQIIENVVSCALGEKQWVRDPVNGNVYHGRSGLAPDWYSAPLSVDGRRWVTACMGQRLNAYGVEVPILLKGNTPPIYDVPFLDLAYPFEESLVYGDVFSAPISSITLNVCWNKDLYERCTTQGLSPKDWLQQRICDSAPNCGLNIMGPCETACMDLTTGYKACLEPGGTYDDHTVQVQLMEAVDCKQSRE